MARKQREEAIEKHRTRRVKLADVIEAGLTALGGALGWELRKRRGKPELYVQLDTLPDLSEPKDNLTSPPPDT